jgi:two-component system response regulator FixJ
MSSPKVHVVDDDEAARDSLTFLLSCSGIESAAYGSAADFLAAAAEARGCVVTDIRMPGMDGLAMVRLMKARGLDLPVIVMTGHGDVPLAVAAMKEGVLDFIEKPFDDSHMLSAVHRALAQLDERDAAAERRAAAAAKLAKLSGRERDVLIGLVGGKGNKVIAQDLEISPRTVEIYRAHLMTKLGAQSLSDLVRLALIGGVG